MSSSTIIGNLVNYGDMPMGGTQVYHIGGTAKRSRTVHSNKLMCTVVIVSSSSHGYVHMNTTSVALNVEDNPCFWQLWVKFEDKMLHKKGESKPFIDLHAPLMSMSDRTFYTCDWTPEHETLRSHLAILKYTHSLSVIDEEVRKAQEELDRQLERRAKCLSLLEEAQKNK